VITDFDHVFTHYQIIRVLSVTDGRRRRFCRSQMLSGATGHGKRRTLGHSGLEIGRIDELEGGGEALTLISLVTDELQQSGDPAGADDGRNLDVTGAAVGG